MGVIVNKENNQNDQLSKRIEEDLRARAVAASEMAEDPDYVDDSEYVKDFKKSGRFGWVWIVLVVLAILSILAIIFS